MSKFRAIGICQRTGFKVPADELVQEWTGLWVWAPYFEEKHPSLDQPSLRGERVRPDATGPGSDIDNGDSDPAPDLDELGANN